MTVKGDGRRGESYGGLITLSGHLDGHAPTESGRDIDKRIKRKLVDMILEQRVHVRLRDATMFCCFNLRPPLAANKVPDLAHEFGAGDQVNPSGLKELCIRS